MPSAKHNSTMDIATELITSLFAVALLQDVPIRQPQYVQYMHHGLAFNLSSFVFTDNARCQFAIAWCGFPVAVQYLTRIFRSNWIDCRDASCTYCSSFVTLCTGLK